MAGLADGFVQGFGLMDQHLRGQAADRRADEQLRMHRENAAWQRKDGDRRFGLQERQMDHGIMDSDRRFGLAERGADLQDQQFAHTVQQADRQYGLQRQQIGLQQQRFNAEQARLDRARQDQEDEQWINSAYALLAEGRADALTDQHQAAFARMPWLDPSHLSSERMGNAVAVGEALLNPESADDLNSPQALSALNDMFMPEINRGEGGDKRISRVLPGPQPGSVVMELEVTRPDGSTYTAPMTEGRGTEDDAIVLQVPMEKLVDRFAGYRTMHNTLNTRPDMVSAFAERMGVQSGARRDTDKFTDREKRELDFIESEIKAIRESAIDEMGMPRQPSESETQHLQSLLSQREAIMGGGARRQSSGEPTILQRLLAGEGGDAEGSSPVVSEPVAAGGAPPPRPGSAGGYIESRSQSDASARSEAQADDDVQALAADARRAAGRIANPLRNNGGFQRGGLTNRAQGGGIDSEAERAQASELMGRVSAAYDSEADPRRKAQLQRALDALYDAGVTAP